MKKRANQAAFESTELVDLPQRTADVDTAVKRLFAANADDLPIRELLVLDKALQRQQGMLDDNLAKLRQLDADIAAAEQELGGEVAAADPEKNRRIEDLIRRLLDERTSRLEATAANREALRSQFSRVRETVTRILAEDTTLAERIRTLFREQGVTIASLLSALGFMVSTTVLAIQNTLAGGTTPTPEPDPTGAGTAAAEWVKSSSRPWQVG